VAPGLAGLARVSIVPDGPLDAVNFAALPLGRGGYLAESGVVLAMLGAERDRAEPNPERTGQGWLALADPDYAAAPDGRGARVAAGAHPDREAGASAEGFRGHHSTCRDFGTMRFASLPGTAREVATILALRPPQAPRVAPLALTGAQASEGAFRRFAPGRREVHLATHGFVLDSGCDGVVAENPLVRCGLALAGANRRDEAAEGADDGVLTGEEIGSLDLSSVECAVLSACESGLGEMKAGEGVLGLRRAFRVAGARSLVMSLWNVGDAETAEWMTAFYRRRLARGADPADALAAAEREVLRARRAAGRDTHPWSWGAFVASALGGHAGTRAAGPEHATTR
jgi:CHAT domain-containing protein